MLQSNRRNFIAVGIFTTAAFIAMPGLDRSLEEKLGLQTDSEKLFRNCAFIKSIIYGARKPDDAIPKQDRLLLDNLVEDSILRIKNIIKHTNEILEEISPSLQISFKKEVEEVKLNMLPPHEVLLGPAIDPSVEFKFSDFETLAIFFDSEQFKSAESIKILGDEENLILIDKLKVLNKSAADLYRILRLTPYYVIS